MKKNKVPRYISESLENDLTLTNDNGDPMHWNQTSPTEFMKHMDTSFGVFFYQRDFTERNFAFYIQVLAKQHKDEEALKAFRRMEEMGIEPTSFTYNQLQSCFAKTKNIDMVLKLIDEAQSKYGIVPCKFSYNNIINCYARLNQPNEAENVFREMVDKGLKPDIVTYTTLIDAFKRAKDLDRCWQIYNDI